MYEMIECLLCCSWPIREEHMKMRELARHAVTAVTAVADIVVAAAMVATGVVATVEVATVATVATVVVATVDMDAVATVAVDMANGVVKFENCKNLNRRVFLNK